MDGRELFELLREWDPALARRVIFLTGDSVSSQTRDFLASTGNLFITKPFSQEELLSQIGKLMKKTAAAG